MSFDGLVTYATVAELKNALLLGKIEKIYQPQAEQLVLAIHTKSGKKKLFISAKGNHSAVYLIDETPDNPSVPPLFCMVLRKHIGAGRIAAIQQYENDRIIEINIDTINELGFSINKKLIIELMGKHSNIILIDLATNKIIDSIKHVSIDINRERQLLPGKLYTYPPAQEKIPFTEITEEEILKITKEELQTSRSLLNNIQGISPPLAETIAENSPYQTLNSIICSINDLNYKSIVYLDDKDSPVDFHVTPLTVYKNNYVPIYFNTVSEATSYYFKNREATNIVKQKSNDLLRIVSSALDKLNLKKNKINNELIQAESSDKYRLYGELLTANLQKISPGGTSITVLNYYTNENIKIPLDNKISASKNSQRYYKKYAKSKTAIKQKKIQLQELGKELMYLESVYEFIEKANNLEDLSSIKEELTDTGFIRFKKSKSNNKKTLKSCPYSYIISSGKTVLSGKNNKDNDDLTFKKASSSDIWFHTKDIPGSHTILFTEGKAPSEEDLIEAASIAAYHSKGSSSENVPVDYTKIKYVKKPNGAKPGMVIFTHNKTLYVSPCILGI